MRKIILKFYKISKEEQRKYNLYCVTRYKAYDYINKIYIDAGLPDEHITKKEFLQANKCRFIKVKRIEKIKKFEKVIKENNYCMLQIIILYNMFCHENYTKLTDKQKEKILSFLYTLYLKDDNHIDIGAFSDIAMNNYTQVLNGEITKQNIYDFI